MAQGWSVLQSGKWGLQNGNTPSIWYQNVLTGQDKNYVACMTKLCQRLQEWTLTNDSICDAYVASICVFGNLEPNYRAKSFVSELRPPAFRWFGGSVGWAALRFFFCLHRETGSGNRAGSKAGLMTLHCLVMRIMFGWIHVRNRRCIFSRWANGSDLLQWLRQIDGETQASHNAYKTALFSDHTCGNSSSSWWAAIHFRRASEGQFSISNTHFICSDRRFAQWTVTET